MFLKLIVDFVSIVMIGIYTLVSECGDVTDFFAFMRRNGMKLHANNCNKCRFFFVVVR